MNLEKESRLWDEASEMTTGIFQFIMLQRKEAIKKGDTEAASDSLILSGMVAEQIIGRVFTESLKISERSHGYSAA